MKVYYPLNAEITSYCHRVQYRSRPNRWIPNQEVSEAVGFVCPKCQAACEHLEHGRTTSCSCGLMFQLFGNALHYWQ